MANFKTDAFRNLIFAAGMAFASATIGYALIDNGTDTVTTGDDFMNDVTAGAIIARTANLASKTVGTVAVGTIDAADPVATAVTGATVEQLALCENTGTAANDDIYMAWDTGVTGLPATPNGGDITVQINASGIIAAS
jgi:hypothetical protein